MIFPRESHSLPLPCDNVAVFSKENTLNRREKCQHRRTRSGFGDRLILSPCLRPELSLRRAIAHPGFSQLGIVQRAQVLTNLGNLLNHIGRFVEAVEAWNEAITLVPKMGMANGNLGIGLTHYASHLYDSGHNAMLGLA